jgi:hypothetical protein
MIVSGIAVQEVGLNIELIHIAAVTLFIAKIVTGIWLRKKGRPVPGGPLNLHKFIAIGTFASIAMSVRRALPQIEPEPAILAAIAFTSLTFLIAIITGGLVSLAKPPSPSVKTIHAVSPVFAVLSIVLLFYLFIYVN